MASVMSIRRTVRWLVQTRMFPIAAARIHGNSAPEGICYPEVAHVPPAIHTVFSVDSSPYQHWQAELLSYSHRKVSQPGPLTRLWSGWGEPPYFNGQTFQASPASPHPITDDDYAPYNRIMALDDWLRSTPIVEDTILLLDPDCIFLAPIAEVVDRGRPISQAISYLDVESNSELVHRHCRRPAVVQGIGIPTLIHRDDLAVLVPLWIAKTEAIRNHHQSREQAGWISEMWGYAFAAAELGLWHEERDLAAWQNDDRLDRPIVHYCYESQSRSGLWIWNKRTYRPWERIADPPLDTPLASAALVRAINEWASIQQA